MTVCLPSTCQNIAKLILVPMVITLLLSHNMRVGVSSNETCPAFQRRHQRACKKPDYSCIYMTIVINLLCKTRSTCWAHFHIFTGNPGLPKDSVLSKILQVQMLDNLDIEGIYPLYKRVEQYLEEFPKERWIFKLGYWVLRYWSIRSIFQRKNSMFLLSKLSIGRIFQPKSDLCNVHLYFNNFM